MVERYYCWEMTKDKNIQSQINAYHKLLEDLKSENIILPKVFDVGLLIEKMIVTLVDYKQQFKHKHKQMSFIDLMIHIIIEETNKKKLHATRTMHFLIMANLVQEKGEKQQRNYEKHVYKLKAQNHTFKRKGLCFVCSKLGHHASK